MSVSEVALPWGPEFRDPSPFHMSHYVREFVSDLVASRFTDMRESDQASTVSDRHNVSGDTGVGEWVKYWSDCG